VVWSVGLLLFYTVAGFLIVPPIVRLVAASQLSKQLNRKVSIAKVRLNPYTMSATIRGLVIEDPDGQPFLSWDEVYANLQLYSVLTRTLVLKEVRTTQPFVRVQVNADYTLNFSDILEKLAREAAQRPKDTKPGPSRGLRIDRLSIAGARMSATDLTTKRPFTKMIGPLELTLNHFATSPDNRNPYSFTGTTQDGETFSWSGHFFLDPIRSVGEFALDNVSLSRYAPLYQDLTQFEIRDGVLALRAAYLVEQGQTNTARLTNVSVSVRSLKLAETGQTNHVLDVPEFNLSGMSADAFGHSAHIDSIQTRGGRLAVRRNADASINLIEIAKPNPAATNAAGSIVLLLQSVTNVVELLLRSTNAWSGTIQSVQVQDYAVEVEDLSLSRPVHVSLDDIRVQLRHISNRPGSNLNAQVHMRWNMNGTIETDTALSLYPIQAEVNLALDGLDIHALDPYVEPFLNLQVTRGQVGMKAKVRLAAPTPDATNALPQASFQGDVWVSDFATVDGRLTEDFVEWKEFRISGIDATLQPLAATVSEVALRDARARLAIDSGQTNNVFTVLRKNMAGTSAVTLPDGATGPTQRKSPKAPMFQIPTNLISAAQALPRVFLTNLVLTNIHVDYVDRSLQPPVVLTVNDVAGNVQGISTEDLSRADVHITGKVGKAGPVEVSGKINLLGTNDYTDVKMAFKDIELIPTSPYSGKFLGYRLNKGKLSLDVHYQLADGKLKGQNLIRLDQLTLGERVDSPDALKLPIKLGIAILKDRSGRIELDVPVEGSLADPEFRLSKVITRALLNVFTKIVTSPFAALGSLFGGKGEEVSYQEFAAGSTELTPANQEKLASMAKALYERPGLQLEIEAATDPVADRQAIQRLKLRKQYRTEKWASLRKTERAQLTAEQLEIKPEEYQAWIAQTHARRSAEGTLVAVDTNASTSASATNSSPARTAPSKNVSSDGTTKGATALFGERKSSPAGTPNAPQDLEADLLQTIEVNESDFTMLAAERARRVKEHLVQTGQVEAERIQVAEKPDETNPAKGTRVVLHLR
jgi:hypothetical protein